MENLILVVIGIVAVGLLVRIVLRSAQGKGCSGCNGCHGQSCSGDEVK